MMRFRSRLTITTSLLAAALLSSCGIVDSDDCAELVGQPEGALGYLVIFHDGVPAQPTTGRLAEKYGFTTRFVFESGPTGFSAVLSESALGGVRCEPVVRYVEHNVPVVIH